MDEAEKTDKAEPRPRMTREDALAVMRVHTLFNTELREKPMADAAFDLLEHVVEDLRVIADRARAGGFVTLDHVRKQEQ